jgi:hypothetical protein
MRQRVRVIPIPIVLVPIGAIKPPTSFNNFSADLIKQVAQNAAEEILKQIVSGTLR